MRHLSDGTLRRLVDEPLSVSAADRAHFATCPRCRRTFEEISADAQNAARLLAASNGRLDPAPALVRLRARIAAGQIRPAPRWKLWLTARIHRSNPQLLKPIGVAAVAAALVGTVAFTPAGSFAQSFITIFQVKQVAAVPITSSDLRTLPSLTKYGTVHVPRKIQDHPASNWADAAAKAHLSVAIPASLPPGVSASSAKYDVIPGTAASFTFSAAQARRATAGRVLPRMPARIDGSTLRLTTGTAVVVVYGNTKADLPSLVVGEMKAPRVSSTGVSVKEIENYVLSLPGVSPQLASAIRSIGDPATTLPIPIPVDLASAHNVQVQGVQGLAIGDSTGVGSVVVWQKNGIVYGVGGTQSESDILTVANSLHE